MFSEPFFYQTNQKHIHFYISEKILKFWTKDALNIDSSFGNIKLFCTLPWCMWNSVQTVNINNSYKKIDTKALRLLEGFDEQAIYSDMTPLNTLKLKIQKIPTEMQQGRFHRAPHL